jgi:hypothetical protein
MVGGREERKGIIVSSSVVSPDQAQAACGTELTPLDARARCLKCCLVTLMQDQRNTLLAGPPYPGVRRTQLAGSIERAIETAAIIKHQVRVVPGAVELKPGRIVRPADKTVVPRSTISGEFHLLAVCARADASWKIARDPHFVVFAERCTQFAPSNHFGSTRVNGHMSASGGNSAKARWTR